MRMRMRSPVSARGRATAAFSASSMPPAEVFSPRPGSRRPQEIVVTARPQTWHYGLVARYWAERNTGGPEIAYFRAEIERRGQPALDAGCGTGRLLIPFLQAGLDADGCDVSPDMLALCRQTAEREGVRPRLYQQALHDMELPRRYRTIVVCGVFGIGGGRRQDTLALQRFYQHLNPGGALLLDNHLPYG